MGNRNSCMSKSQFVMDPKEEEGKLTTRRNEAKISLKSFVLSYILGKGGFGIVSAGMHIESGKWFAIKEINLNLESQKKYSRHLDMINHEINAHKLCAEHPYICSLHHTFRDETASYLVLDLYVGGDLRYYLRKGEIFSEQTTAFIVTCLASALEFLHSKGILHRDVKPDNVMFDEYGFPSLTDFGICFLHKSLPRDQQMCQMSSGTRQYVAPELLTSTSWHGASSDLWSLGILAYELIYGQRPFPKRCPVEFIEYNECLQCVMEQYDNRTPHVEHTKGSLSSPTLRKTSALKLLLPHRPYLVIPRISVASQRVVSGSCRAVLKGLLEVRPDQRLRYQDLREHAWFAMQGCLWDKIEHCEVVPPFVPNVREVSQDVQYRHSIFDNNDHNVSSGKVAARRLCSPRRNPKRYRSPRQPSHSLDINRISLHI